MSILTLLNAGPVLGDGFNPDSPVRLTDSYAGGKVTLSKTCADCAFGIVSSFAGVSKSSKLQSAIEQPTALKILSPSVAIVSGLATWFASVVTIFNPTTGAKLDEFICYRPSISPARRYVAFVRFYPAHGPRSENTTDAVAIYDATRNPAFNNSNLGSIGGFNEGILVYPAPPDGLEHRLQGGITWSSAQRFSFVDQVNGRLEQATVILNNDTPSVTTLRTFSR